VSEITKGLSIPKINDLKPIRSIKDIIINLTTEFLIIENIKRNTIGKKIIKL
jgi:hypothetical protein